MSIIKAFVVPHPPLIVPEVGRGDEEQIKKTTESYQRVDKEIAKIKPDTIIITSPHTEYYNDYYHISPGKNTYGSFANFGAPQVTFNEEYDEEFVNELNYYCQDINFPAGTLGEKHKDLDHGTMVPLYFIEKEYKDFKLVRIGLSNYSYADHYKLGQIINTIINKLNRRAVFVASGDLSHKLQTYGPYGYIEEGPIYDNKIMETLEKSAFNELLEYDEEFVEKAAVCGHKSFIIMSGALDGYDVKVERLSHEDITGVGYGLCIFTPTIKNDNRKFLDKYLEKERNNIQEKRSKSDEYVQLAINTIYEYIKTGKVIEIPNTTSEELLENRRGVFVSIHMFNQLRGCIGTIYPTCENVAEEIINNAISASTRDNRFTPIIEEELDYLDINVDVLQEPEEIDNKNQLDIKKYGVIVSSGYKKGLLLPDIPGIESIDQQIEIAKRKGNIQDNEDIKLQRFEVIRHI